MQQPSPVEKIKQATATAHAATEKALIKHIKATHNKEGYAKLLACMYGYFKPLEELLEKYTAVIPDYPQRRKAGKLLDDINSLHFPQPQHFATNLPAVTDPVAALACFYVLEGSVLGGAVIKKMVQQQSPGIPEQAFTFFSGYQEHTGSMWKRFITGLNQQLISDELVQRAAASANDCFDKLGNWIKAYYAGAAVN